MKRRQEERESKKKKKKHMKEGRNRIWPCPLLLFSTHCENC
jgi:hypothetical protein